MKYEKFIFLVFVAMAISIIAIPECYVTGDGPSHTYNAKVWIDYLLGEERNFYHPFFQLNKHIEPNWMSHLLLGFFTRWLKPMMADKLFQILYVLVFAYGFRQLIRAIRDENIFLSYLCFPFLFTLAFQQGFYNYSLAIGLLFWAIAYYIRNYAEITSLPKAFSLFALLTLTSLAHGMIAAYTLILIGALWFIFRFRDLTRFQFRLLGEELLALTMIAAPLGILLAGFVFRTGLDSVPHALSIKEKLLHWTNLYFLISTKKLEFYPLVVAVFYILSVLIYAFVRLRTTNAVGVLFLLCAVYTGYAYATAPHSLGGAGSVDLRLAFLPLLAIILFAASVEFPEYLKKYVIMLCFILFGALLAIRFPAVLKASDVSEELLSCRSHIRNHSVVLNLHLDDWHHISEKNKLFEQDASFIHLTDYLGAYSDKKLILLNNYEADLSYFPVQWRPNFSVKYHAPKFTPGNYPPCDQYQTFEQATSTRIDYILFQNWNTAIKKEACVEAMVDSIRMQFNQIYTSPTKQVVLFERK